MSISKSIERLPRAIGIRFIGMDSGRRTIDHGQVREGSCDDMVSYSLQSIIQKLRFWTPSETLNLFPPNEW